MEYKVFSKNVDIAITGSSQAGKSTFISSLYDENVRSELLNVTSKNVGEGQTKVPTYYALENKERVSSLKLSKISFNKEGVEDYIIKTYKNLNEFENNIIVELFKKLGFYDFKKSDGTPDWDKIHDVIQKENNYLEKLKIVSVSDFVDKYINNEFLVDEDIQIIHHIEISGPASDSAYNIMHEYEFERVVLRDSRGWLDEPPKKAEKLIKNRKKDEKHNNENKEVDNTEQELFDERGLSGAKACIIMNGQGNAITNMISNMYGSLIKQAVTSMPVFLVERSSKLEDKISSDTNLDDYDLLMQEKSITGHNFKGIKKVLEDVGLFSDSFSPVNNLAKKHFKELLLVDSYDLNDIKSYNAYVHSVDIVFGKVLKELAAFRKTLDESFNFVKRNSESLVKAFIATFNTMFIDQIYYDDKVDRWDNGLAREKYIYYTSKEVLNYRYFYGSILGPRGGITTYEGGYKYGVAIGILKTAHNIIDNIVNGILTNEKIIKVVRDILDDDNKRKIAINNMYVLFRNYIRDRYYDKGCNATLGKLAPRYALVDACLYVRQLYEKNKNFHYGYFNECPNDRYIEKWETAKKDLSVIYALMLFFINEFLKNNFNVKMNYNGEIDVL